MDEYDFYDDCDPFERFDDYNVFEERELMADYQAEQWDYLDSEEADFDADWREEA